MPRCISYIMHNRHFFSRVEWEGHYRKDRGCSKLLITNCNQLLISIVLITSNFFDASSKGLFYFRDYNIFLHTHFNLKINSFQFYNVNQYVFLVKMIPRLLYIDECLYLWKQISSWILLPSLCDISIWFNLWPFIKRPGNNLKT